ncbi:MAG: response regulator [Proteobacteria bacterium]|nr:response regulator [Pseudomonadota bacterium]
MSEIQAVDISVLVIDDQRAMRSIVRQLLSQIGIHDIHEARNGEEALKFLNQPSNENPDVIICDLYMDKMDGLEFCNQVRRDKEHDIPIIILTGDSDALLHEVSKQVGAVAVLTKPVSAPELLVHIRTALGRAVGA